MWKTVVVLAGAIALAKYLRGRRLDVGVWWDHGEGQTLRQLGAFLRLMRQVRMGHVAIVVNDQSDTEFDYTDWTPDGLRRFGRALRRAGINPVLTIWGRPTVQWVNDAVNGRPGAPPLAQMAVDMGAVAIEFDNEGGNWGDAHVRGFSSLAEAGRVLVTALRRQLQGTGIELQMTDSGSIDEDTARLMDAFATQAYSRYKGGDPDRAFGAIWGPGNHQRRKYNQIKALRGPRVIMGLPAWDQEYPSRNPHEAMMVALTTTVFLGVREVRYWSAKWLFGEPDQRGTSGDRFNGYAFEFLRAVAQHPGAFRKVT